MNNILEEYKNLRSGIDDYLEYLFVSGELDSVDDFTFEDDDSFEDEDGDVLIFSPSDSDYYE